MATRGQWPLNGRFSRVIGARHLLPVIQSTDTSTDGTVNSDLAGTIAQDYFWTDFNSNATGTIAATTADTTAAIAGTVINPVTGTITASTANTTSAIAGNFGPSGTIAASTADTSLTASGTFTGTSASGTIAATTAATTAVAAGAFGPTGTISASTADTTLAATGTFTGLTVTGTIAASTDPTTATIAGTVANPVTGTIAANTADTTASISGIGGDAGGAPGGGPPFPFMIGPIPEPDEYDERLVLVLALT